MFKALVLAALLSIGACVQSAAAQACPSSGCVDQVVPAYLYKIVSVEDWQASQGKDTLKLSPMDAGFIHFSTEDQVDRIVSKYWSTSPQVVVLKVKSAELPGKMVYETNPGGSAKYYHLYNGSIPMSSVVESKVVVPTQK